jgi:hypothetical protein
LPKMELTSDQRNQLLLLQASIKSHLCIKEEHIVATCVCLKIYMKCLFHFVFDPIISLCMDQDLMCINR